MSHKVSHVTCDTSLERPLITYAKMTNINAGQVKVRSRSGSGQVRSRTVKNKVLTTVKDVLTTFNEILTAVKVWLRSEIFWLFWPRSKFDRGQRSFDRGQSVTAVKDLLTILTTIEVWSRTKIFWSFGLRSKFDVVKYLLTVWLWSKMFNRSQKLLRTKANHSPEQEQQVPTI